MFSCTDTASLLSDHADGELGRFTRWRLERHLAVCARCRPLYESLVRTIVALRALKRDEPAPKPELADTVVTRIQGE